MSRYHLELPPAEMKAIREACKFAGVTFAALVRALIKREITSPTITATQRVVKIREVVDNAARDMEIIKLADAGTRYDEIGQKYGLSRSGVARVLERARKRNQMTSDAV